MIDNLCEMELQTHTIYNQCTMLNGFIGIVNHLSQVCLAIYDTNAQPFVYTGSENIVITKKQLIVRIPNENKQRHRVKSKSIR